MKNRESFDGFEFGGEFFPNMGFDLTPRNDNDEYFIVVNEALYSGKLNRALVQGLDTSLSLWINEESRRQAMKMVIEYVEHVVRDRNISSFDLKMIDIVNEVFQIRPGDYWIKRYEQVKEILCTIVREIFSQQTIDQHESHQLDLLSRAFLLSHGQMQTMIHQEVQDAINNGVHPDDIDVFGLG